jgi:hypothetical protein
MQAISAWYSRHWNQDLSQSRHRFQHPYQATLPQPSTDVFDIARRSGRVALVGYDPAESTSSDDTAGGD